MSTVDECVYCGSKGPFNREHIFPVALGGDDSGFILESEVCADCNSKFSVLEGSLFREHILGYMRWADHYVEGRKGRAPVVNARAKVLFEEVPEGLYCEGSSIDDKPVPQIVIRGDLWVYYVPGENTVQSFFDTLESAFFKDTLSIVTKVSERFESKLFVCKYERVGEDYKLVDKGFFKKPPKSCIWLESSPEQRLLVSRSGGVLIQVTDTDDLSDFLRLTHRFISNAGRDTSPGSLSFESTHVSHTGLPDSGFRALAKIAINLTVRCAGVNFVNQPEFIPIKEFVRGLRPKLDRVKFVWRGLDKGIDELVRISFGTVPQGFHVFWLAIEKEETGLCNVLVSAWLYNSCYVTIPLAYQTGLPDISKVLPHTFLTIDHQNNKVVSYTWDEYDKKYGVTESAKGHEGARFSFGKCDIE